MQGNRRIKGRRIKAEIDLLSSIRNVRNMIVLIETVD